MATAYTLEPNAPLAQRNTLRIVANTRWLATVHDAAALPEVLALPQLRDLPLLVLGDGSNLLLAADFPGVMLKLVSNAVTFKAGRDGFDARRDGFEARRGGVTRVSVDAGANWDALVTRTLDAGCAGLENLALIPGLAGAAPIQNIGAYGAEVESVVESVEAFDRESRIQRTLARDECEFGYRDSRFKRELDRWIVTRMNLRLPATHELCLEYAGVREALDALGVRKPRAADVADAVRRLRRRKLPDPVDIGNAGSFFKNPVLPAATAVSLKTAHPALPVYSGGAGMSKLSAAWLIESCGWRGHRDGDAGISERHALVLVNHGHATGAELLDLARRVAASVEKRYGIRLEPEPRIVGAKF